MGGPDAHVHRSDLVFSMLDDQAPAVRMPCQVLKERGGRRHRVAGHELEPAHQGAHTKGGVPAQQQARWSVVAVAKRLVQYQPKGISGQTIGVLRHGCVGLRHGLAARPKVRLDHAEHVLQRQTGHSSGHGQRRGVGHQLVAVRHSDLGQRQRQQAHIQAGKHLPHLKRLIRDDKPARAHTPPVQFHRLGVESDEHIHRLHQGHHRLLAVHGTNGEKVVPAADALIVAWRAEHLQAGPSER